MSETLQYKRIAKFELHELIGEGAMGVVWKAYDSVLRRFIALKLMGTVVGRTHDMRERFLREARAAGALQHPNIVTVYDLGEAENQLFIAMELVEGRDLSELIASNEPLPLERKLDIVIEVLQGLAYAHERGIIHRDIKPSNVRLTVDGRVKIMDFGIARLQSAELTRSDVIVGTPTYMAPEQITNGAISPATDLFAVGGVLYELLSYRKPFEAETVHGVLYQVLTTDPKPLRAMAPSIPSALERVVMKAMHKLPKERYESARQMQENLLGIRAALSDASDTTTQRLAPPWSPLLAPVLRLLVYASERWRAIALSAAAVAAVVALVLWKTATAPITPGSVASPAESVAGQPALPPLAQPPAGIDSAMRALRDTALGAQLRARRAGAMKNSVAAAQRADSLFETAEVTLRLGDPVRAAVGYREAVVEYRTAQRQAAALRQDAARTIERVTPLVRALPTHPDSARAARSLARAESLLSALDFSLAKLAARDAEQVAVAAGVVPPTPQPAGPRAAIEVLLQDLARALASERVANLRPLYPAITPAEARNWQAFFREYARLTVRYTVERFSARGNTASADVEAVYRFAPERGGVPGDDIRRLEMRFTKTPNGWRIANVRER